MSGDTDGHEGDDDDRDDQSTGAETAGNDFDEPGGSTDESVDGQEDGPLPGELSVDTDAAVEELDRRFVDLLSWLLDTETRARIYVYLRKDPNATSEEVADGTGLYPSTVRECLAEMAEDGVLERQKRQHAGAGNNPYEYAAIAPSDLVGGAVGDLQSELNSVFNLDCLLGCADRSPADDAVTISVADDEDDDTA
jgi:predicted transcriptional regulator